MRVPVFAGMLLALAGCAAGPTTPTNNHAEPSHAIGWVAGAWRLCRVSECPRPTPKTVSGIPSATAGRPVSPTTIVSRGMQEEEQKTAQANFVVHFPFAKAKPTREAFASLEAAARTIRPNDTLRIVGFTDDIGTQAVNDRLARDRAEYVALWLKRRGLQNPMKIEANGKCCYVATNSTEEGRALNRRVEIRPITPHSTNGYISRQENTEWLHGNGGR